jgi:CubicO group peptidase (beta-lactamase class C family)
VLGILISRVTGRPLGEHLAEDVFGPLGTTDTALWVAEGKAACAPKVMRCHWRPEWPFVAGSRCGCGP